MDAPMSDNVREILSTNKGAQDLIQAVLDSEKDPDGRYVYYERVNPETGKPQTLVFEKARFGRESPQTAGLLKKCTTWISNLFTADKTGEK